MNWRKGERERGFLTRLLRGGKGHVLCLLALFELRKKGSGVGLFKLSHGLAWTTRLYLESSFNFCPLVMYE
jgi:hypothetical protein